MNKIKFRLNKFLYITYQFVYAVKVLSKTLQLWGYKFWINFWFRPSPSKEFDIQGLRFIIEDNSFVAKLFELNVLLENIMDPAYLPKTLALQNGDSVVDIGAHLGSFSIPLAVKYPEINIYAYEPAPKNYQILLKNIAINGVKNLKVFNLAVA